MADNEIERRLKVGYSIHIGGLMRLDVEELSVDSIYVTVWASPLIPFHMGMIENVSSMLEDHFGRQLQYVELNYPSFSVVFMSESVVKYKSVVKNVGRNANTVYEVKVNAPSSVETKVTPSKLSFSEEMSSLSYEISFSSSSGCVGLEQVKGLDLALGSIVWSDGIHSVRSPIAVRWLSSFAAF
ncbi:hypothetical protein P3L10_030734 [Capsicum annuum]